jgi:cell division GTPase FtsZ
MTFDESYEDEVKVTIIATGFSEQSRDEILKQPRRDMLGRPTREAESFITRGIKKEGSSMDPFNSDKDRAEEKVVTIEEDLETPAFIRRSLNKENK